MHDGRAMDPTTPAARRVRLSGLLLPLALLALLGVAAWLRFAWPEQRELFRDEAASWVVAHAPWSDIIPRSTGETYPPLYVVMLKLWIGLFGDGVTALRSLSAAAGVALVAATWAWAREAIGLRAAFVAGVVVALSPIAIANAREARMYALEALWITLAWWLIWRLLADERPVRDRGLAILAAAAAVALELWTLPTGGAAFGLQAIGVGLVSVLRRRPATAAGLSLALGFAAFLPWLPFQVAAAASGEPFWTAPPNLRDLTETFTLFFTGTSGWPIWLAVYALGAMALLGAGGLLRSNRDSGRAVLVTVGGGAILVLAWWTASLWRSAYDARYLGSAIPPLAVAIGAGSEFAWRWATRSQSGRAKPIALALAGAAVLLLLASATQSYLAEWVAARGVDPAEATVAALQQRVGSGDAVLAVDARSYFPLAYLVEREASPLTLPAPLRYWRSGREPGYFGSDLIGSAETIGPETPLTETPGLAPSGRIWLVALTDPDYELANYTPLSNGKATEVARVIIREAGASGVLVEVVPARP
jgi:mannosyltransferase